MDIIPPINIFSTKQWLSIIGANLAGALLWASHFVFEYYACFQAKISIFYVVFAYIGCVVGGILALFVFHKLAFYPTFIGFIFLDLIFLSLLFLSTNIILLIVGLLGTGFCGSIYTGRMFVQLSAAFPDPQYNGRANALGYILISISIILFIILIIVDIFWIMLLDILLSGGLIIFFTLQGIEENKIPSQFHINLGVYLQAEESIKKIMMAVIWGFFLTLPFYYSFLLLQSNNVDQYFIQFILILFITVLITSIPNGMLLDSLGRKIVMLLGLCIQALGFVILFFTSNTSYLYTIFPAILGIGTTMFLTSNSLFLYEISLKKFIQDTISFTYILMGIGMILAVLVSELLHPDSLEANGAAIIIILFMLIIAIFIISQVSETLPPKQELEWKGALHYISVMYKSGITIYTQQLLESDDSSLNKHEDLLGGAIVAVSSIVKEMAKNKKPLKVIRQENFTILIEEGNDVIMAAIAVDDINKVRRKMQEFLEEFEDIFHAKLGKQITNIRSFDSTKDLVKSFFQYYW